MTAQSKFDYALADAENDAVITIDDDTRMMSTIIATLEGGIEEQNDRAAFFVKACNNHERLVEALRMIGSGQLWDLNEAKRYAQIALAGMK